MIGHYSITEIIAAKNHEKNKYFELYESFMELNLCQHLALISSFKICLLNSEVYATVIKIAEFILCIKRLPVHLEGNVDIWVKKLYFLNL